MQFSRIISIFRCAGYLYPDGDKGIRTLDPLLARQVLSQLSYTPTGYIPFSSGVKWTRTIDLTLIRRAL